MSFEFHPNQSVGKNICRLAHRRIQHALSRFESQADQSIAIHSVRKDIKKLRALLRLVRASLDEHEYRRSMKHLRRAAAIFAAVRDAKVKSDTFAKLVSEYGDRFRAASTARIKYELEIACKREVRKCVNEGCRDELYHICAQLEENVERWHLRDEWESIGVGLHTTYKRGRCCLEGALKSQSAESFHEWRKRTKDLWYKVRLLRPVWPAYFETLANELEQLSDKLGEDHDLAVLDASVLQQLCETRGSEALAFRQALQARQNELRSQCGIVGRRLYAEKASSFCDRIELYWNIWREA